YVVAGRAIVYAKCERNTIERDCPVWMNPQGGAQMQRLLLLLISTVLLCAQAQPDSATYSVAYVDILPASRTAAITAIKQYRDASRKDAGFQRIEFFEQSGRPAHFCIIETWANSG